MIGKTNVGGGGVRGIDFGEVTLSSSSDTVTFEHSLGVVPSFAAFIPKNESTIAANQTIMNINGFVLYKTRKTLASGTAFYGTSDVGLTETTISFNSPSSSPFKSTTYYWIAIV